MNTPDSNIDWTLTTFKGAEREQLRRWSRLSLEDVMRSQEDAHEQARAVNVEAYAQWRASWLKRTSRLDERVASHFYDWIDSLSGWKVDRTR